MPLAFDEDAILAQARQQGSGSLEYKHDFVVKFTLHAVRDATASERSGRNVYTNVVYFARKARDVKDYITAPATDEHFREFPREYAEFRQSLEDRRTHITKLPRMNPAAYKTLEELGVFTIEDFAALAGVYEELSDLHAIARRWVAEDRGTAATVDKRKGGWPKGKPRGRARSGEDAQADS